MFNIGIDFDNTLVNYDRSFYELAIEKNYSKKLGKVKVCCQKFFKGARKR